MQDFYIFLNIVMLPPEYFMLALESRESWTQGSASIVLSSSVWIILFPIEVLFSGSNGNFLGPLAFSSSLYLKTDSEIIKYF